MKRKKFQNKKDVEEKMLTQIQFYDKDVVKNTLGVITNKPDKVVFVYDCAIKDMNRFKSLEKCFKRHLPNIILEKYPVNILKINEIYETVRGIIEKNGNCIVELTGGSELMTIAGFKAGRDMGTRLVYTDILAERVMDLNDSTKDIHTEELTLEDFVDARGACFVGNSHSGPPEELFDKILEMCQIIFRNIKLWRDTCAYFQTAMANSAPEYCVFHAKYEISQKDGKKVTADRRMIDYFERLGFIKNLYYGERYIDFEIVSPKIKSYMISYGVWLELFVYINAKRTGVFKDVRLGTMIDWDAYDGIDAAENEIDVIFMDKSMPVFVSCKLRDANTAALNELLIEKKRIGGWFSKSIIVAFGESSAMGAGTYKRAREYGIEILDKDDIMSDNFCQKLLDTVRGSNPLNLKWKKV